MNNSSDKDRLWVIQLQKEHKEISWYHRVSLAPVIVIISDNQSTWGQWDSFYRTISISRKLITNYSWDIVLEVFKHEMAHQYVSELMNADRETPHGESFKIACRRLGVATWAAKAAGDIPLVIPSIRERVVSQEDDRLLSRVEKLLSLAQSSNEHEAFLAMERVRELYAKHNLDSLRQKSNEETMDGLFLTQKKKKTDPTEAKILAILNDHFKVQVIHTRIYDAAICESYKAAEVLGRRENVLMAEFVYYFLHQQISSLWTAHNKKTKCKGTLRRSYQLGVLSGFDQKLTGSKQHTAAAAADLKLSSQELSSLMKIESTEISAYVKLKYPRISSKSWGGGRVDFGAFSTGQTDGRSLNLNKPMSKSGLFGGFLGR